MLLLPASFLALSIMILLHLLCSSFLVSRFLRHHPLHLFVSRKTDLFNWVFEKHRGNLSMTWSSSSHLSSQRREENDAELNGRNESLSFPLPSTHFANDREMREDGILYLCLPRLLDSWTRIIMASVEQDKDSSVSSGVRSKERERQPSISFAKTLLVNQKFFLFLG